MINRRRLLQAGLSLAPALVAAPFARAQEPVLTPSPTPAPTPTPSPTTPAVLNLNGRVRLPDGRRLGYAEYGDPAGRLVLYFHGTPGSRIEARLISAEAAAAKVKLVAVERPGIGLSDYQNCRQILDWPADVEAFTAALGYVGTSFGVIGMSGGAPFALACLKRIPHRLTHVALVSGHTPIDAPVEPGNQDKLIRFVTRRPRLGEIGLRAAIRMLHNHPDRFLKRASQEWSEADRQYIMCSAENRQLFIQTVNEAVRCGSSGILRAIELLGGPWGFRLCDLPGNMVTIWQGGCDPIVTPSMGHYFHQQLTGSELMIDPRAGHLTMPKWHAAEILARVAA